MFGKFRMYMYTPFLLFCVNGRPWIFTVTFLCGKPMHTYFFEFSEIVYTCIFILMNLYACVLTVQEVNKESQGMMRQALEEVRLNSISNTILDQELVGMVLPHPSPLSPYPPSYPTPSPTPPTLTHPSTPTPPLPPLPTLLPQPTPLPNIRKKKLREKWVVTLYQH